MKQPKFRCQECGKLYKSKKISYSKRKLVDQKAYYKGKLVCQRCYSRLSCKTPRGRNWMLTYNITP